MKRRACAGAVFLPFLLRGYHRAKARGPSPQPSPKGRGSQFSLPAQPDAPTCYWLPLPRGEGWGEGPAATGATKATSLGRLPGAARHYRFISPGAGEGADLSWSLPPPRPPFGHPLPGGARGKTGRAGRLAWVVTSHPRFPATACRCASSGRKYRSITSSHMKSSSKRFRPARPIRCRNTGSSSSRVI